VLGQVHSRQHVVELRALRQSQNKTPGRHAGTETGWKRKEKGRKEKGEEGRRPQSLSCSNYSVKFVVADNKEKLLYTGPYASTFGGPCS
jgi:hypothetical protein